MMPDLSELTDFLVFLGGKFKDLKVVYNWKGSTIECMVIYKSSTNYEIQVTNYFNNQ